MHITDNELVTIRKPFLMLKYVIDENAPENKEMVGQLNLVMKILDNARTPDMMGASSSSQSKTKELFEMFHLTNRIK